MGILNFLGGLFNDPDDTIVDDDSTIQRHADTPKK